MSQNASTDLCQELDMSLILGLVIMPVLISVKSLTFLSRVDMSLFLGLVIMPVLISVKSLTFLSRVDMSLFLGLVIIVPLTAASAHPDRLQRGKQLQLQGGSCQKL